jgi:Fe2+ or Zn2+ uptake regulation protein/O6-methylguanine-DNA--protein-cysteine methyltransferase
MAEDPAEMLRRRSLRVTPQRRAILEAFSGSSAEHLSADEVHARANRVVPELGRGTVYATLAELTELGLLAALGSPEPVRYETNVSNHSHFRCNLCLRLFDVQIGRPSVKSLEAVGHRVERVAIVAEGVCAECEAYERGLEDGVGSILGQRQVSEKVLAGLACSRLETEIGPLALAASADGIVRIAFEDHADFDPFLERARSRRGPKGARDRLAHASTAIEGFLGGSERVSDDLLDEGAAELIDTGILTATRRVAYGATLSYERLDGDLGPYDRGWAMGTNPMPILFPCHRITRGAERPPTYIGGAERRRQILGIEAREVARRA